MQFAESLTQTSPSGTRGGDSPHFLKCKRDLFKLNSLLFPWSQQALNPCENQFLFVKQHDGLLPFNTWDSVTRQGQGAWSAMRTGNARLISAPKSCNFPASAAPLSLLWIPILCCFQPHEQSSSTGWWVTKQFFLEELTHWKGHPWFKGYTEYKHPRTACSAWRMARITGVEARLAFLQLEFWSPSGFTARSPMRLSSQTWACFSAPHLCPHAGKMAMRTKPVVKRQKKF